jgi:ubiquinone/menaquinone biosynthesis C-methylase UbiE
LNKSLEEIVFDLIELFRPYAENIDSVLDIGTGTSIPIHIFADNFPNVRFYTIDIVDFRKRKEFPFVIYNGENLPFDNLKFDVSLLNETLHHCKDPEFLLGEARRVAKSVYVIEHFPNPNISMKELINTEFIALKEFEIPFQIYKPFTEKELYSLFGKIGLEVCDTFNIPYYGSRKIVKYFFKLK